ncbi:hypothetical protein AB833_30255 [Chromatiales bacterium (ex Bugula neritina AB1)]|nr:hypothetical protein AB833_30255 [Chromatiales bacterium (ex Bugula neritina AB1)]
MNKTIPIEDALKRVHLPIESANGLPNSCYVEHSAFERDRDCVFAPGWISIGFGSDVPANWAVPVELMGYPLLITRDKNNTLRVFHNVCSHRGMQLVTEPGKLGTGLIRCKYHSWTYNFSGDLIGTPSLGGPDINQHKDFNPEINGLKPVRTEVWLDNIFINLDNTAEPFENFLSPLMQHWSKWVTADALKEFKPATTHGKLELVVNCNWKLAIENFLEAYHLPWVHPGLNTYSPLSQHYDIKRGENFSGQGSSSYSSPSGADGSLSSWPEDQMKYAEYPVLYPNTLLGLQSDHFFTMTILPISETESLERVQLMFLGEVAEDNKYDAHRKSVLEGWREVFAEDIFAVEGMQQGRRSPAYQGGVFSPVMDQHTLHFHQWIATRIARDL